MKTKTREESVAYLQGGVDHMTALLETINEDRSTTMYTQVELLQLIGAGIFEVHRIAAGYGLTLETSSDGRGNA